MPGSMNNNLAVQECAVSQTITMKVNGNNVTLKFSPERNDAVCKQVKKILLASYINHI